MGGRVYSQGESGPEPAGGRGGGARAGRGGELRVPSRGGVRRCLGTGEGGVVRDGRRGTGLGGGRAGGMSRLRARREQGQTGRRHLEKYAAAELLPTPPRPSPSVRQPDKDGGVGRDLQLDDHVTTNVS